MADTDTIVPETSEVVVATESDFAVGLSRAEIDVQIATAHRYPRALQRAMGNILSMATLDEDTAEECMYAVPRGGKTVEGPSARFAEMVLQNWGNCRVAAWKVKEDRESITVRAIYHDLETNTALSTEVQRRIVGSRGQRFNPDMIQNTVNAASSIARRNIILAGVPKAVWRKAYEAARHVCMGDVQTLANRRAAAIAAFQKFGVTAQMIFDQLDVGGEDEITLDHLVTLRAMLATLKNGESTAEQMFAGDDGAGKPQGDPNYNPLAQAAQQSKNAPVASATAPAANEKAAEPAQKAAAAAKASVK